MLASPPYFPAQAVPLSLGSPRVATIAPLAATYYSVSPDTSGKLTVMLDAPGFAARLSLVDAEGQPLVQSDGPATGAADGLIDVNVPAGIDYLEVQSLSGGGTYQITANLIPTVPAFQTIPTGSTRSNPIAAGKFRGTGFPVDLVAPDGIHVGNGDGTFQSTPVDGPLALKGWTVTAIAVGDFNQDNLPDIAFTETRPGKTTAQLCVLQNEGGRKFQLGTPLPVDSHPVAIQTIDFGNGIVDLAVADSVTGHVAIFVGNGQGGFTPPSSTRPPLDGGVTPSGMVAGRFRDGHIDLIVADKGDPFTSQGQGLTVFQADGPDAFQPSGTIAAGSGPSAIVAGYFEGADRPLDLAVADSNSNQVSILLNNGNGTFQSPQSYPVGTVPQALVAGDFGNGHIDLATANENSYDVSVLLGNGNGTFQPQLRFGAGKYPVSLVTADFNGDRRLDLATGNWGSGDISILLGRGDGTFQDQVTNPVGNGPLGAVTADLTHDGHTDIITANHYSNDISVLLGNGDGTFQAARSFPAGEGPTAVAVADFNGDGRYDVAVADSGDGSGNGEGVAILLGNGDGTFQAPIFYPAGTKPWSKPWSIVVGDWTGSGVIDLAVANIGSDDVTVLMGNGNGTFRAPAPIPLGVGDQAGGPAAITAGDFTGKGVLDLAVADQSTDSVSILKNNGRGGFTAQLPIPLGDDPFNHPEAIVAGDFGNGHIDLAVASTSSEAPDSVSILLDEGNGTFDPQPSIRLTSYLATSNFLSIAAGHFFGGGPLDLAVADSGSNSVPLLQGYGQGGFHLMPAPKFGSQIHPYAVATGDFTGDGRDDLAIASQSPNSVEIDLNQGNGQFAQPGSVGLVTHNTPVVADFSGDGVPDVAIVDGAGHILFRRGRPNQPGSFDPPITVNADGPLSRDIAAVRTSQGTLLASVDADAKDNAVSFFAYRNGGFRFVGSLATGVEPAQIVSADLMANGEDDLVIRNAGAGVSLDWRGPLHGTLTVYMSDGRGWFLPQSINIAVGPGISDVSVADVNQNGLLDILLANETAGEVEVIRNQGAAGFSPPALYRAGTGLSSVDASSGSPEITSLEATSGVAAGAFTTGAPTDLLTVNTGSNTLGLLAGLGDGRFANPGAAVDIPTAEPAQVVRVADFNHGGIPDVAVLGNDTVSIYLGNGQGGFLPHPFTINAGLHPTGLTVADLGHNGNPDLLIGNEYGDVLVLAGQGNGTFRPLLDSGQKVALAVADLTRNGTKDIIYAGQNFDNVVVDYGGGKRISKDASSGLLAPGAVAVANLNDDGKPYLIVANSGGNNVLVYPGLSNGQFGPELNGGKGFFTGTDPVGVTVARLNGRLDLVVADRGSNDVTILLNQATADGGFTFVPGPRLNLKTATQQGIGPVATAIVPSPTGGPANLAVSMSGSNQVWVIPGIGGGFFNDQNPTIFNVGSNPGPVLYGNFDGRPDLVTIDAGSNDLTLISNFLSAHPVTTTISSGGTDPDAAFSFHAGSGFDDLVVGNGGDGVLALFKGSDQGLSLTSSETDLLDLPSPSALVYAGLAGGDVQFYAASAGHEAAILVALSLGGEIAPQSPPPSPMPTVAQLAPLQESSLALVGTFLITAEIEVATTLSLSTAGPVTLGQGSAGPSRGEETGTGDDEPPAQPESAKDGAEPADASWQQRVLGTDEALDRFDREHPDLSRPRNEDPPETNPSLGPGAIPAPAQENPPPRQGHPAADRLRQVVDRFLDHLHDEQPDTGRVGEIRQEFNRINIRLMRSAHSARDHETGNENRCDFLAALALAASLAGGFHFRSADRRASFRSRMRNFPCAELSLCGGVPPWRRSG